MLLKYLSTLMNEIQNVGTPRVPFGHLAVTQNNFKIRFNILRSTCPFIKCSVVNQLKNKQNPSHWVILVWFWLLWSDGEADDQTMWPIDLKLSFPSLFPWEIFALHPPVVHPCKSGFCLIFNWRKVAHCAKIVQREISFSRICCLLLLLGKM